jgi:hypothetical protein
VVNPRLNLDFGILKNRGVLESLDLALGTGLFSSLDGSLHYLEARHHIGDFDVKPSRAWTSLAGISLDFTADLQISVESYYKQLFDRTYTVLEALPGGAERSWGFDGEGNIWGVDVLLRKTEGRYWDGWISYSFNYARYYDNSQWYYPPFHRFHTINMVVNLKPQRQFNIAVRLGFASGKPQREFGPVSSEIVRTPSGDLIEQFMRTAAYSDSARTAFSLPLDLKFSWFRYNPNGKARFEMYAAVENTLAMMLPSIKSSMVNRYTGQIEEAGGMAVMTQLSMPMPSFGAKWSF